jgi:tRNA threonylcarbamoyladenosine biosynthesis protein TsaB
MNILLIESSSKQIEFGFSNYDKFIILKKLDSENNADSLIYKIREIFIEKGISFKDIDVVSLSNGPGSFTGLRIGSAIAKGICYVLKCKFLEIPTLDIIANKYEGFEEGKIFTALIFSNSRSGEFYSADYINENSNVKRVSDYSTKVIDFSEDKIYLINGLNDYNFPKNMRVINLSNISNIHSQLKLSVEYIDKNRYSDFRISEPFYMKKFVPLKSIRKI